MEKCHITDLPDGQGISINTVLTHKQTLIIYPETHNGVPVRNAWKMDNEAKGKDYIIFAKSPEIKSKWMDAFRREQERVAQDRATGQILYPPVVRYHPVVWYPQWSDTTQWFGGQIPPSGLVPLVVRYHPVVWYSLVVRYHPVVWYPLVVRYHPVVWYPLVVRYHPVVRYYPVVWYPLVVRYYPVVWYPLVVRYHPVVGRYPQWSVWYH